MTKIPNRLKEIRKVYKQFNMLESEEYVKNLMSDHE